MPLPLLAILAGAAKKGSDIYRDSKRQEFMAAQKGLLEAQLKQMKANDARQEAQDAFMQQLPPQQRMIFGSKDPLEMFAALQMLPGMGQPGQAPAGAPQAPGIPAGGPAGQTPAPAQGILGMSPQQVAEQMFKKKLGLGEDKLMERGVLGPGGKRGKAVYNLTQKQPDMSTFVPDAPELDRITVTKGGKKMEQYIDKTTRQPVGEPFETETLGEKPLGSTEANMIALTKNSLRDAQTALDALFSDGSPDTMKMLSAQLSAPGSKGREFSQAWDRAVKPLMVALTGTGMSEREASNIINMSKPQVGDSQQSIQSKAESLVNFMQERLRLMDPQGQYGVVNVTLPWQKKASGSDLYDKYGLTRPGQ